MSDTETLEKPAKGGKAKGTTPAFSIERDAFLAAISTTKQVVEARNTIPILSNLAFRARQATLTMSGTDLDMLVEVETDCAAFGEVATTVASDRLASAVETLRAGRVEVAMDGPVLLITQGSSRRRLNTLAYDDFPQIKVGDTIAKFEIEAGTLLSILNATALSMSTEETRYYLNGVFFHTPDGTGGRVLRAASTDGHRLAIVSMPLPSGAEATPDIIVARKSVREMRRLLDGVDGKSRIPIEISNTKMVVRIGAVRLVAKLIDGTFPDYSRTVPTANKMILTVHSTEWARCMRAAAAMTSERTRGVRLEMSEAGCQAIGQSPEVGNAVEPIDGEFGPGDLIIGVNSRYALDIAATFGEAATLKLAFADPAAPILITSDDRPAIKAVLMPMRA
jgi:DNA polymerase-3 subunit beta